MIWFAKLINKSQLQPISLAIQCALMFYARALILLLIISSNLIHDNYSVLPWKFVPSQAAGLKSSTIFLDP